MELFTNLLFAGNGNLEITKGIYGENMNPRILREQSLMRLHRMYMRFWVAFLKLCLYLSINELNDGRYPINTYYLPFEMKTYLLDILKKFKRFDESLDVKTFLCNKTWIVFNPDGPEQTFIFKEDGGLIIAIKGKGKEFSWELLSANKTIKIIEDGGLVSMYHPTIVDNDLLVLWLDGIEEFSILINSNADNKPKSIDALINRVRSLNATPSLATPAPKPSTIDEPESVSFADCCFTRAQRNGTYFYVNPEQRYAFSSIEHVFAEADNSLLVKTDDGKYTFYYNNSLDNRFVFPSGKPDWEYYWDGLVLEGILLGRRFLYYNGQWYRCFPCFSDGNGYSFTDCNKEKRYFKIASQHLVFVTEKEVQALEGEDTDNTGCILGVLIGGAVLLTIMIVVISGA